NPTTPVVEEVVHLTDEFLACYPNPVRVKVGNAIFKYYAVETGQAELRVYNLKGQLVRSIKTPTQPKGKRTIFWHLTDQRGVHVSSGVYFYKLLQNGKDIGSGKITVIK
ncbi:MAG: T9SS type A sorting domain-containing protein, partial [Candidatus Cloacimonetes bacterium]|nr:T9SS type A sorting domain-containing protein [Candidatus Cloacimonadota bacterium]